MEPRHHLSGMADFMVLQVIALILVMLFPEIALWFPRWLLTSHSHRRGPGRTRFPGNARVRALTAVIAGG